MLLKVVKISALIAISACTLNAGSFNTQAEKDKQALVTYMEAKFKDADKNRAFFPYSSDDELKNNFSKNIKEKDFALGSYAFNSRGKSQYDDIKEMPPYEDAIDTGEELYSKKFANGKSFKTCFPKTDIGGDYPYFDDKMGGVVTLTAAINDCLVSNDEKKWGEKKGKMAKLQAYFAFQSQEAGKKMNIKIDSQAAADAYERGKKEYYSQRGYLKLSCASCHVQGTGQRVRAEYMSPLLGQVTHFPVFRLKWNSLGTLERRMTGCNKDQGENPHKPNSKWMKELLYFMAYMSNGMAVDGPDIRK
jgi:sulfur-oxidizing protein SoxA